MRASRFTPAEPPLRTGFITPTPYKTIKAERPVLFNQIRTCPEADSDSEEELVGLAFANPQIEGFRESHMAKNLHQETRTRQQSAVLKSRGRDGDGDGDGVGDGDKRARGYIDPSNMDLMCHKTFKAIDLSQHIKLI